jgi:membrane protein DedA with SNARE-associated domain
MWMDFELKAAGEAIIQFARKHQEWAPLIVGLMAFGESLAFISLVLPFFTILIGIGALIGATGSVDFWIVLFAAAIGAALGDWLSYWLGRHYHAEIARMWPLRNYPDLLPRGERFFKRWGAWAVVLGRFTGPLRASVPIVAGAVHMPQGLFQLANWTSAFLWAAVLLTVGGNLGELATWSFKALGRG